MTGFDELLMSRVTQLREIDDRLERIEIILEHGKTRDLYTALKTLRADIILAIQQAEREHTEF